MENHRRRFLKDNNVVSNLKLRASYGEIGNQAISPYQTMTRLKSKHTIGMVEMASTLGNRMDWQTKL